MVPETTKAEQGWCRGQQRLDKDGARANKGWTRMVPGPTKMVPGLTKAGQRCRKIDNLHNSELLVSIFKICH